MVCVLANDVAHPPQIALVHADDMVVVGIVGTSHLTCGAVGEGDDVLFHGLWAF